MPQVIFFDAEYIDKREQIRREHFLAEMKQMVPRAGLLELIESFYRTAGNIRPQYQLETRPSIHLLQKWFALSDSAIEIVDSTIIHSPSSTKIPDSKRDTEMHQARCEDSNMILKCILMKPLSHLSARSYFRERIPATYL